MLFFVDVPYLLIILPIGASRWPILWPIFVGVLELRTALEQLLLRKSAAPPLKGCPQLFFASFPQADRVRRVPKNSLEDTVTTIRALESERPLPKGLRGHLDKSSAQFDRVFRRRTSHVRIQACF
jgi:hypothetical protein